MPTLDMALFDTYVPFPISDETMVALYTSSRHFRNPAIVTTVENLGRFIGRYGHIGKEQMRRTLQETGKFEMADLQVLVVP